MSSSRRDDGRFRRIGSLSIAARPRQGAVRLLLVRLEQLGRAVSPVRWFGGAPSVPITFVGEPSGVVCCAGLPEVKPSLSAIGHFGRSSAHSQKGTGR